MRRTFFSLEPTHVALLASWSLVYQDEASVIYAR